MAEGSASVANEGQKPRTLSHNVSEPKSTKSRKVRVSWMTA